MIKIGYSRTLNHIARAYSTLVVLVHYHNQFFFSSKISHSIKLNAIKSNYWGGLGKIFNLEKLEIRSVQDLGKKKLA